MTPAQQLKAWRLKRGLSLEAARDVIGVNHTTLRMAEAGRLVRANTALRIRAVTGIEFRRPDTEAPLELDDDWHIGRHCPVCCGLTHRRPRDRLCKCGEAWAPDVVACAVPSLQSSAALACEQARRQSLVVAGRAAQE